jgi:uncharacterized zinc-type alcohol dehydrogenase-like protein
MAPTRAYGAESARGPLGPLGIERREPRPDDVAIEILYCGICHTDIHFVHNDWGVTPFTIVPGHEIVGRVTAVGAAVTAYAVGDTVGVGCMVDACRTCGACDHGLEPYCRNAMVVTDNGRDRHDGSITFGGYSEAIVVAQRFVVRVAEVLETAAAAPLLCAGITTYSPLRHYGGRPGHRVGVVGMGGLGHMGIKFARAFGAQVTVFTRSQGKVDAAYRQGAHQVVVSSVEDPMAGGRRNAGFRARYRARAARSEPVSHDPEIRRYPYLRRSARSGGAAPEGRRARHATPRPGRLADRGHAGAAEGTGLLRGARYLV